MRFLDLFVKHRKYVTFKPIRKMLVQYLKRNVHFPTSNGFVRRIVQRIVHFTLPMRHMTFKLSSNSKYESFIYNSRRNNICRKDAAGLDFRHCTMSSTYKSSRLD